MNKLLEKRNAAYAQARSILEGAGDDGMTAEQEQAFDAAMEEGDKLEGQLTRSNRLDALKQPVESMVAAGGSSTPVNEERSEQYRAFESFIRHGMTGAGLVRDTGTIETRAQGVATGPAGGFLVPDEFRAGIIKAQKAFGGLSGLVQAITTSSGTDLTYPIMDDTGNTGALIAENTAVTELDVVVGNKILRAWKWTSRMVRVSNELLQDNTYNLDTELASELGTRISRGQAPYLITGSGVNEPEGLLTNKVASETTVAGATTTLGAAGPAQDALINLETDLEESYLANASYLMHRSTLAAVRKIRDADGRAIWQPSLVAGQPTTINGYNVTTDSAMPVMAPGAKIIAFGDFRQAYVWRQVSGIAIRRLNERFAEFDQVAFVGFARADGQVQNAQAYQVLANAAA